MRRKDGQGKRNEAGRPVRREFKKYNHKNRAATIPGGAGNRVGELELRTIPLVALSTPLPLGADGIQLIDEDDGWSFLLGQGKGIPDELGTIPNEHLHQLGASQLQEGGLGWGWG